MADSFGIPSGYNDNKVVLMVRDPWTIYSYWEINKDTEARVRERIKKAGLVPSKSVLRVYEVSGEGSGENKRAAYDFELKNWANSWYVHAGGDGRKWMVEIGIFCSSGDFFCLAGSNVVQTPRYSMSEVYDEEWMCPEELYSKLFAASGGFDVGKSSLEMKEMISRYLREWVTSGGVSSGMFGSNNAFRRQN
jgi:hypothetical protein